MRKIIVLSTITLDGIIQAPGAPKEDASGGFKYGGWAAPTLVESTTIPSGVIMVNYKRAGEVKTGTIGE